MILLRWAWVILGPAWLLGASVLENRITMVSVFSEHSSFYELALPGEGKE